MSDVHNSNEKWDTPPNVRILALHGRSNLYFIDVQMADFQDPEEVKANLKQLYEYQLQVDIGSSNT